MIQSKVVHTGVRSLLSKNASKKTKCVSFVPFHFLLLLLITLQTATATPHHWSLCSGWWTKLSNTEQIHITVTSTSWPSLTVSAPYMLVFSCQDSAEDELDSRCFSLAFSISTHSSMSCKGKSIPVYIVKLSDHTQLTVLFKHRGIKCSDKTVSIAFYTSGQSLVCLLFYLNAEESGAWITHGVASVLPSVLVVNLWFVYCFIWMQKKELKKSISSFVYCSA